MLLSSLYYLDVYGSLPLDNEACRQTGKWGDTQAYMSIKYEFYNIGLYGAKIQQETVLVLL